MNDISVLTREMVNEYESLIGRKLTPSEYLGFRNHAMMELNGGYGTIHETKQNTVSTTMTTQNTATPVQPQSIVTEKGIQMEQNTTVPVVSAAAKEIVPPVVSKPVVQQPVVQQTQTIKPAAIQPTVSKVQNNDPFFSMIDNMSV